MNPVDTSEHIAGLTNQEIREYLERSLEDISATLSALASPVRMKILLSLLDDTTSFADLKKLTGLKKSALSTHLTQLKELGLIDNSTHGHYEISDEGRNRLVALAIMFRRPRDMGIMKQRTDAARSFLERRKDR